MYCSHVNHLFRTLPRLTGVTLQTWVLLKSRLMGDTLLLLLNLLLDFKEEPRLGLKEGRRGEGVVPNIWCLGEGLLLNIWCLGLGSALLLLLLLNI